MGAARGPVIGVIVFALLLVGSCGKGSNEENDGLRVTLEEGRKIALENRNKVFLFGLDGFDWQVIEPLIASGRLPNLKKLIDSGAAGVLRSEDPMHSPALWTTVATGHSRKDHSIGHFIEAATGQERLLSSNDRTKEALWNIVPEYGKTVGVINWWATWPAEPVKGFMFSKNFFYRDHIKKTFAGTFTDEMGKDLAYPPELLRELLRIWPDPESEAEVELALKKMREIFGHDLPEGFSRERFDDFVKNKIDVETHRFTPGYLTTVLASAVVRDRRLAFTTQKLLDLKGQPDLLMVYTWSPDQIQHHFWEHYQPSAFEDSKVGDVPFCANVIPAYYEYMDQMLGDILKRLDPDTTVIVCSDHGFQAKPDHTKKNNLRLETVLRELGYLAFKKKGGIDWERTVAWDRTPREQFWNPVRHIRLNITGRDPHGAVEPDQKEHYVRQVIGALSKLTTTQGEKLFTEVRPLTQSERASAADADLLVQFDLSIRLDAKVVFPNKKIPLASIYQFHPQTGDHRLDGVLVMAGPAVGHGAIKEATLHEIAPTILYLMGIPVGEDMSGRVLTASMDSGYLAAHKRYTISTHEKGRVAKRGAQEEGAGSQAIRDELRNIGYFGGGTGPSEDGGDE